MQSCEFVNFTFFRGEIDDTGAILHLRFYGACGIWVNSMGTMARNLYPPPPVTKYKDVRGYTHGIPVPLSRVYMESPLATGRVIMIYHTGLGYRVHHRSMLRHWPAACAIYPATGWNTWNGHLVKYYTFVKHGYPVVDYKGLKHMFGSILHFAGRCSNWINHAKTSKQCWPFFAAKNGTSFRKHSRPITIWGCTIQNTENFISFDYKNIQEYWSLYCSRSQLPLPRVIQSLSS